MPDPWDQPRRPAQTPPGHRRPASGPGRGNPAPERGNPAPGWGNPAPEWGNPAPEWGNPAPEWGNPAPAWGSGPAQAVAPRPDQRGNDESAGRSGGAEGNERLTALTGAVLLVLLAAEGFTILSVRQMLTPHFFIGMLLLGPVALKLGSTVYRFTRYYTGSAPYRRKGPPSPLLRLLGPVVVAATVGVFGSGIMLAVAGPGHAWPWMFLHKGSFVVWFGAMSIHVLAYLSRIPGLVAADLRGRRASGGAGAHRQAAVGWAAGGRQGYGQPGYAGAGRALPGYDRAVRVLGGRGVRLTLLVATLLAGLLIAALTVHLAAPWHNYLQ